MENWDPVIHAFELNLLVSGAAPGTISARMPSVRHMAAAMAANGMTEPRAVTSGALTVYMIEESRRRRGAGVLTHYNSLRSFWDWWAAEYDPGRRSPMTGLPRPRKRSAQRPVLTDRQLDDLLGACGRSLTGLRDRALICFLASTGARRAEACALTLADVDIRSREAVIRRGKGGKGRTVVFDYRTAQALQRYLMARNQRWKPSGNSAPLWVGRSGEPLSYSSLGQLMGRLGRRAGIEGFGPHLLRHMWADRMMRGGIPEHDIARLAGWTTTAQLQRYGAAVADERAISAVHALYSGRRGHK